MNALAFAEREIEIEVRDAYPLIAQAHEVYDDAAGLVLVERLVGEGVEIEIAAELGVAERIRFLGRVPHDRLRDVYGAADVSVLASVREGWPNVLLESMACGTPAVATRVGGVPEIITRPESGAIVDERTPEAIARVIADLLAHPPAREATRAYAEEFGWDATTEGQINLFRSASGA